MYADIDAGRAARRSPPANSPRHYRAGAANGDRDRPAASRAGPRSAPAATCGAGRASTRGCSARCRCRFDAADRRRTGEGTAARLVALDWSFPGLRPARRSAGARACRARATLLARDGTVLAESPGRARRDEARSDPQLAARRTSPSAVVGTVGPIPPRRGARARSAGRAGRRDRRRQRPRARARRAASAARPAASCWRASACSPTPRRTPAAPVRTLDLTRASAGGGRRRSAASYGGIVAMQPSTGQILAVAGHRPGRPAAAGLDVQDDHRSPASLQADSRTRTPCSPTRRTPRSTGSS